MTGAGKVFIALFTVGSKKYVDCCANFELPTSVVYNGCGVHMLNLNYHSVGESG